MINRTRLKINKMKERDKIRKEQSNRVMPMIGKLLDVWDDLPNDVKSDPELNHLAKQINKIDFAMEEDIESN